MLETQNTKQLEAMVGKGEYGAELLRQALDEVSQEDIAKKKSAVKELIRQAVDLSSKMSAVEKSFLAEKAKYDKQLGGLLKKINNFSIGSVMDEPESQVEVAV